MTGVDRRRVALLIVRRTRDVDVRLPLPPLFPLGLNCRATTVGAVISPKIAGSPFSTPSSRNIFFSRGDCSGCRRLSFDVALGRCMAANLQLALRTSPKASRIWRRRSGAFGSRFATRAVELDLRVASRKPSAEIRCVNCGRDRHSGILGAVGRSVAPCSGPRSARLSRDVVFCRRSQLCVFLHQTLL